MMRRSQQTERGSKVE